jgi:hypothetical protein
MLRFFFAQDNAWRRRVETPNRHWINAGRATIIFVNTSQIRDYVARDWERIEHAKSDYWTIRKRDMTASEVFEVAAGLREYARRVKPDWPNPAERQDDLESHIHLAQILSRASQSCNR